MCANERKNFAHKVEEMSRIKWISGIPDICTGISDAAVVVLFGNLKTKTRKPSDDIYI